MFSTVYWVASSSFWERPEPRSSMKISRVEAGERQQVRQEVIMQGQW
jgi:hypothetical protein